MRRNHIVKAVIIFMIAAVLSHARTTLGAPTSSQGSGTKSSSATSAEIEAEIRDLRASEKAARHHPTLLHLEPKPSAPRFLHMAPKPPCPKVLVHGEANSS